MNNEVWKYVPGYENKYKVSSFGNVESIKRKVGKRNVPAKKLTPCMSGRSYYSVVLWDNSKFKRMSVHQLVAMAFLSHTPNGNKLVVDHIDGNKLNNNIKNLRVLSHSENLKNKK